MNRLLTLIVFSCFFISTAQVGIGTTTPDAAAVLDINAQISTTEYGGLKLPTVTTAQRALINTPIPDGLMIYLSDGSTRCLQLYNASLGSWLDVYCMNLPPVALTVSISGTTNVGDVLTTNYDETNSSFQTDNENDTPDVPLYQWYSNTTPSGLGTAIAGATNDTYTIVAGDAGNYISLGITPQASTGASPGIEVRSAYSSQVTFLPTIVEFDPQLTTIAENATPDDIDLVFEFPNVSTNAVQVTVSSNDYSRLVETGPVTITIPANQTSPFTTTVFNIQDNLIVDGTANLTFTITNVTGGLGTNSIGTDDTDLWDITDDDGVFNDVFQDFDLNTSWNYTLNPVTYNVSNDVWAVTNTLTSITTLSGNFFGMRDLNNPNGGGGFTHTMTFDTIDVSSATNPIFSFNYESQNMNVSLDRYGYELFYDGVSQGAVNICAGCNSDLDGSIIINIPNTVTNFYVIIYGSFDGASDIAAFDNFSIVD